MVKSPEQFSAEVGDLETVVAVVVVAVVVLEP